MGGLSFHVHTFPHSTLATWSQNQVFIIIIPLNGTRSRWNLFYGEGSVSGLLMTSHLFHGSIVLNGHHLINHHQQQRWPPQTNKNQAPSSPSATISPKLNHCLVSTSIKQVKLLLIVFRNSCGRFN